MASIYRVEVDRRGMYVVCYTSGAVRKYKECPSTAQVWLKYHAPEQTEEQPEQPEQAPEQPEQAPEQPEQAEEQSEQAPEQPEQAEEQPEQAALPVPVPVPVQESTGRQASMTASLIRCFWQMAGIALDVVYALLSLWDIFLIRLPGLLEQAVPYVRRACKGILTVAWWGAVGMSVVLDAIIPYLVRAALSVARILTVAIIMVYAKAH